MLEGTVTRSGERLRVTAQLITVPDERHVWADKFERTAKDVLALQGEIASAIAAQINIGVTPRERINLAAHPVNAQAHELYLKGRFDWETRQPKRLRRSLDYFQQAIALDTGYALAYAGLADSYDTLALNGEGKDLMARSCEAAKKALELDETLGQADAIHGRSLHRRLGSAGSGTRIPVGG